MNVEELKIPEHIAIIMDGNGRWAKARHMPRVYGHKKGAAVLEQILEDCDDLGVKFLTVYAFSTENWARPDEEVGVIMDLIREYLKRAVEKCRKNNVRCKVIGDRTKLADDIKEAVVNLEKSSDNNTGITFIIAINYGSRDEIIRSMKDIIKDVEDKKLDISEIDENIFDGYLDTKGIPDPDLLIRTGGEERLSNYLLWQLAYTEFYFTDVAWPAFDKNELVKAIEKYSMRDRRFGKI